MLFVTFGAMVANDATVLVSIVRRFMTWLRPSPVDLSASDERCVSIACASAVRRVFANSCAHSANDEAETPNSRLKRGSSWRAGEASNSLAPC